MLIQESTLLRDLSTLRENILLDTKQEAFVRATISSMRDSIAGLEAKIWDTENALAELHKERDAALESLAISVALLAPVRRLPPEVLGEIFQRCVPMKPTHVTPFDNRDAPLLLTHVCHRWRQVAQGTQPLWTNLVLYGRAPEAFFSSMWLNNSGSHLIDIAVNEYRHGQGSGRRFRHVGDPIDPEYTGHGWRMDRYMVWIWPEGVFDQSSQIVVEQISRIRRLSLDCVADELRSYFPREAAMTTLHSLQELCVKSTPFWALDRTAYSLHTISTPRLQTLVLDDGAELVLPALDCTSNLRNLEMRGYCTLEMFVDFVSRCPALQRIDASVDAHNPRGTVDMSHIVLPGLLYLGLGISQFYGSPEQSDNGLGLDDVDWSRRTKPLERLRTPNLQWAETRSLRDCGRFLSNCIADSQSKLHTLTIRHTQLVATLLDDATSIFTAIERMEFVGCQSSAGFWESLGAEDMPFNMWTFPKLKTLSLEELNIAAEHEPEFVQFAERRAPPKLSQGQLPLEGICYIEEIKLIRCIFSMDTLSALERLREDREGFSIRMEGCWNRHNDSEADQ